MGRFIDGGFVPENDPMFNGAWMTFSIRRPIPKPRTEPKPIKTYFILINPEYTPREPGWLGTVISSHDTATAAFNAQDRVHERSFIPLTTAVWSAHFMPGINEYLGAEASVHVRTIPKRS
jgi:hypothetical protein